MSLYIIHEEFLKIRNYNEMMTHLQRRNMYTITKNESMTATIGSTTEITTVVSPVKGSYHEVRDVTFLCHG